MPLLPEHRPIAWGRPARRTAPLLLVVLAVLAARPPAALATDVPRPTGIYVLNDAANNRMAAKAYATGLTTSPAYAKHITGHAIFVPIAKILPSITTWGDFHWSWGYLDTLVNTALTHNKKFSIELETGFQNLGTNYLQSLPANFAATCGGDCAPRFDVWTNATGSGTCTSSYVLLPWIPNVQQFWAAAAESLAGHLHDIGAYSSLTLVHVPGLSVYDEELRLPTGFPKPATTDTLPCPDSLPAYPTVILEASDSAWTSRGYTDAKVIDGFKAIATSFANAFPDRVLGLSLFPAATRGRDFPNLTADTVGYVASQLVQEVAKIAPGRVQVQADDLDLTAVYPEVLDFSANYATAVGWQSNKHGGTGATCGGDSCGPDGPSSPYVQLLETGASNRGTYFEAWSNDVVKYPISVATGDSIGLYSVAGVPRSPRGDEPTRMLSAAPNPARGEVALRFSLAREDASAELGVFDVTGRRVRRLVVAGALGAGPHAIAWDGMSDRGARVPAGVYFAVLRQGERSIGRIGFVLVR